MNKTFELYFPLNNDNYIKVSDFNKNDSLVIIRDSCTMDDDDTSIFDKEDICMNILVDNEGNTNILIGKISTIFVSKKYDNASGWKLYTYLSDLTKEEIEVAIQEITKKYKNIENTCNEVKLENSNLNDNITEIIDNICFFVNLFSGDILKQNKESKTAKKILSKKNRLVIKSPYDNVKETEYRMIGWVLDDKYNYECKNVKETILSFIEYIATKYPNQLLEYTKKVQEKIHYPLVITKERYMELMENKKNVYQKIDTMDLYVFARADRKFFCRHSINLLKFCEISTLNFNFVYRKVGEI